MEREYKEGIVTSGLGTALCVMDTNETKYHFFTAVPSLPAVTGDPNTIDYDTTTNLDTTHIVGKRTTNDVSLTMPYNLDNINLCQKYAERLLKWAYIDLNNWSATLFTGVLTSWHQADTESGSAKEIAATIVVHSKEGILLDVYDLFEDSITFNVDMPELITVDAQAGKQTIKVVTDPADATVTAKADGEGVITTVSYADKAVTFTPAKAGSALITISATKENYGSNQRVVKVVVTGTAAE